MPYTERMLRELVRGKTIQEAMSALYKLYPSARIILLHYLDPIPIGKKGIVLQYFHGYLDRRTCLDAFFL
jgi:hypothetical protein